MPDIHILTKFYSRDKSVSEIFQNCFFQCYPEIFGILGIRHQNCPAMPTVTNCAKSAAAALSFV